LRDATVIGEHVSDDIVIDGRVLIRIWVSKVIRFLGRASGDADGGGEVLDSAGPDAEGKVLEPMHVDFSVVGWMGKRVRRTRGLNQ
jgi:hypothetical protein